MNIRSTFFGNAAIYTFSNFAVAGIPFLLLPVLTRVLSTADYGMVAMFAVVTSVFFVLVGVNTHGAVMVRFFEPEKFDMARYVTTVLIILLITSCMLGIAVWVFGRQLQSVTAIPLTWLMIAVGVAAAQFIVQTLLVLWQTSKQPMKYGALRISHALLEMAISITLVVVLLYSWSGRLAGITMAWVFTATLAGYCLYRAGWITRRADIGYAKDALRYGVPLVPHAVGGLLLGMTDRVLVTNLLDVASTGIYLAATQLGMILGIFADAFNKAFAPWLMGTLHTANDEKKKQIVINTYIYFFAILAVAMIASLFAPYLIPIILGPNFQQSADFVMFLFFGNAFLGMYYMVTNYIFFSRKTELLSALTIAVGAISVAISWYLIKNFGLRGAAIGFMVGQGLLFLGAWCLAQYCHRMPWFKFAAENG